MVWHFRHHTAYVPVSDYLGGRRFSLLALDVPSCVVLTVEVHLVPLPAASPNSGSSVPTDELIPYGNRCGMRTHNPTGRTPVKVPLVALLVEGVCLFHSRSRSN